QSAGGQASSMLPSPGVFYTNSSTSISDITDGSSNTFAIGEVSDQQFTETDGPYETGGLWAACHIHKTDDLLARTTDPSRPLNRSTPTYVNDSDGFGSMHEGGAHFLMCDGAVRFVSENINLATYGDLGDRADNRVVGEF
ncbi:MAG: DUF1559 domain-containing protein, partial [Planctomycetaceae bacterium]|nr:DUF1559 domain-containing protein [Planctomycetaceae bacterium]